jgi:hypothetical protein
VQAAIGKVIIAEQHSPRYPGAHGVTVNLTPGQNSTYAGLDMPKETGWTGVLAKMGSASHGGNTGYPGDDQM